MSSIQDQQRVFHVYKPLFQGPNARIRKKGKIRSLIGSQTGPYRSLRMELGDEKILNALLVLLQQGAFQSKTEPSLDPQEKLPQADESNCETGTVENVTFGHKEGWKLPPKLNDFDIQSLYLTFIPYRVQHLLLTVTQRLLEECCFEFATKWLPNVLKERKWDCAEAVELNRWVRVLLKYSGSLPQHAFNNDGNLPLKTILLPINALRHSAVHRLHISTPKIANMIESAAKVASVLGDQRRAMQLIELQQEMQTQSSTLEIWKDKLRTNFAGDLQHIAKQRAELDQMEEQAKRTVIQEDNDMKISIGTFLESSIQKILRSHEATKDDPDPQLDERENKSLKNMSVPRGDVWSAGENSPDIFPSEKSSLYGSFEDGCSSDEFSCDDADYEALRLAVESTAPMKI